MIVLLVAIALFALLYGVISLARITGGLSSVQTLAGEIGIEAHQLLEFIGLFVGGTILVGQLWLTHRRVGAAERTAEAAAHTAESTVRSNTAQLFKNAVELLGNDAPIVRIGGIQALGFIARDNPEYRDAVAAIIDNYTQQQNAGQWDEGSER